MRFFRPSIALCALSLSACMAADHPFSGSTATDDTGAAELEVVDLGPIVDEALLGERMPAIAAAVVKPQGLAGIGAAGLRNITEDNPVDTTDQWHLGSDTKAMTATLLAMVVEDGLLSWDTTLADAFPRTDLDPGWAGVTLDDLLHHQGGADSSIYEDHPSLWSGLWGYSDGCEGRRWFSDALLSLPPAETPGSYAYSNAGYILLGAAIEQATGECWQDLLTRRLFEPLSMEGCGFGPPLGAGLLDEPWGHSDVDGDLVPVDPTTEGADNPPGLGPAGTVHCPLSSWGEFLRLHLNAELGEPDLLSADSFAHLHEPIGDYAGGWLVGEEDDGPTLAHAGSNTMWLAWAVIEPQRQRAVMVTTNVYTDRAMDVLEQVEDAVGTEVE